MEPTIPQGAIVVADLADTDPARLKEGKIYILCWEADGECSVKHLRWAEKGRSLLITSPNQELYPPLVKRLADIRIVGRVIWSWRDHH
jgi:phage repressor protein C with HTH and peptisase S24 domain